MTSESIEPSRLWDSETRAGYREIPIQMPLAVDVMAGGGGGGACELHTRGSRDLDLAK
jgi:hypothetical protein